MCKYISVTETKMVFLFIVTSCRVWVLFFLSVLGLCRSTVFWVVLNENYQNKLSIQHLENTEHFVLVTSHNNINIFKAVLQPV